MGNPTTTKAIAELYFTEGKTLAQIGSIISMTEAGVYYRLRRAGYQLRTCGGSLRKGKRELTADELLLLDEIKDGPRTIPNLSDTLDLGKSHIHRLLIRLESSGDIVSHIPRTSTAKWPWIYSTIEDYEMMKGMKNG